MTDELSKLERELDRLVLLRGSLDDRIDDLQDQINKMRVVETKQETEDLVRVAVDHYLEPSKIDDLDRMFQVQGDEDWQAWQAYNAKKKVPKVYEELKLEEPKSIISDPDVLPAPIAIEDPELSWKVWSDYCRIREKESAQEEKIREAKKHIEDFQGLIELLKDIRK